MIPAKFLTPISPITLPGLPAIFDEFSKQESFDNKFNKLNLVAIWRFYNIESNPDSFVNRVEIWKDQTKIRNVSICFNTKGCQEMQKTYSSFEPILSHYHFHHWCKLTVSKLDEILNVLLSIQQNSKFSLQVEKEMCEILKELLQSKQATLAKL